jgi:hypothetical protein
MDTRHLSRTQFVRAALLRAALLAAALSLQSAGFAAPAARAAGVPLTPVAATAAIEFPAPAVHFCEPGPVLSSVASPTAPDRDSIRCPFEVDRRPDGQAMQIAGGEPPIVVDSCARRACRG